MDNERKAFCGLLRAELIGPVEGEGEELADRPDKRYLMGMLFPQDASMVSTLAEEETEGEDARASQVDEASPEAPTDLLFQRLPSSVGVSFACEGTGTVDLSLDVACGRYIKESGQWKHAQLRERIGLKVSMNEVATKDVFGGHGRAVALLRRGARGARIVTVTLINTRQLEDEKATVNPEEILYQVEMKVCPSASLAKWPAPERLSSDAEEDELQLRYRHQSAFAIGHGCAADWSTGKDVDDFVAIQFLPATIVPPVTTEIDFSDNPHAKDIHSLQALQSDRTSKTAVLEGLGALVMAYRRWRQGLEAIRDFDSSLLPARDRILSKIDSAIARMDAGIGLLASDTSALNCFRLANRAMLIQMVYAARVAAVEQKGDAPDPAGVPDADDPAYAGYAWRPFQLAFFLMSVPGLWDETCEDRDIVDLIWFPTGGGKTEAYLAAAAFEMLRRRIQKGPAGCGTAVVTRYTLRLLTQQQFQRSAHLICALEDLRQHRSVLGDEQFSLGLWIGAQSTPLTLSDAYKEFLKKVVNPDGRTASNPFALLSCPCCGTPLVPRSKDALSAEGVGIRCTDHSFAFFCPDARCHRHQGIPVQVIDDALYESPPTMLLGTLDKFAMLAWRDEAAAFFGTVTGQRRHDPPSLIIQDELHLISGPLGTVAGVYEAAIDTIISQLGGKAKVIASTATIRRASEQAQALFAKRVEVFPPSGINASDSFFSVDSEGAGRLYLGAMGQGHTPTYSMVMTASAMMQSVKALGLDENLIDSWWTLVAYHNSRRELGKSLTLANDDIPARLSALCGQNARKVHIVKELSANVPGPEIPKVLDDLKQELPGGNAVDFLGCTNMLSVGVDVSRLGLMLVVGQPRSASEYIQATSRVGRDSRRLPGIVLTLFMPTKPRDRSHYEAFSTFHAAMYRHVEPTSVTPFALPSRRRALHAAAVIAVRHTIQPMAANSTAKRIIHEGTSVEQVAEALKSRMLNADPREAIGIERDMTAFIKEWNERAHHQSLRYSSARDSINHHTLLRRFGETSDPDARDTLQSMRHVDRVVEAKLFGKATPDDRDAAPPSPANRRFGRGR